MPYDTDNRSGITKNAPESQKRKQVFYLFPFFVTLVPTSVANLLLYNRYSH